MTLPCGKSAANCVMADGTVLNANVDPINTEVTDETLTIGLSSEPSALWGIGSGKVENEMMIIDNALTDTLVDVDRTTGELIPNLATSWEWVDEHTVTIEFTTTAPDLLYMLAWRNFGIVSEDEINAVGGVEAAIRNPAFGSGKYRFKEWASGQSITIERNDNYWNPDYKGYYKEIVFTFTNDAASRAMSVMSGDIQVAYDMPVNMASTYKDNDAVNLIAHTFGQNARLYYNMGENAGATKDERVRKALDKAIDFQTVALVGTAGLGGEARSYFPDESPFYHEMFTDEERAQDIEGAKALLAEAGYDESNPLELNIVGMQDMNDFFQVIQENFAQAGVKLNINIVDTAAFVQGVAFKDASYDLVHVGDLVDARYPAAMLFFKQENIDTFCIGGPKYTTDEVNTLVHSFIAESDEEKAKELALQFEQIMKDETWYSNTYAEMHAALTAKEIKGYRTIERGYLDCTGFYK